MNTKFAVRGYGRCGCLAALLVLSVPFAHGQTVFTMAREVAGGDSYTPGASLDVTVTLGLTTGGTLTALGLEETLPAGWAFDAVISGNVPSIQPFPGKTGLLEFAWFPLPAHFPVVMTYRVDVPAEAEDTQEIRGNGLARLLEEGAIVTSTITTTLEAPTVPVPDVTGMIQAVALAELAAAGFVPGAVTEEHSASVPADLAKRTIPAAGVLAPLGATVQLVMSLGPGAVHTGDVSANGIIELNELLRIIQFFNTGGYHCADGQTTEDGYAAGPNAAAQDCEYHDSDSGRDWHINLSELLRFIQFFNSGGYHDCAHLDPPTEDGFCPGP